MTDESARHLKCDGCRRPFEWNDFVRVLVRIVRDDKPELGWHVVHMREDFRLPYDRIAVYCYPTKPECLKSKMEFFGNAVTAESKLKEKLTASP